MFGRKHSNNLARSSPSVGEVGLKRGTLIKDIRLTGNPAEVECRAEKIKYLVLTTELLKKP